MTETEKQNKWIDGKGYNRYITKELDSFRKQAWKRQIGKHFPEGACLDILDAGTGPGFFACILAEEGHHVTAIDQSNGMLDYARENAKKLDVAPCFIKMDLNDLDFNDDSFDVVICRNVTWTLERPEEIYTHFKRVLRPGGKLLIYDANWHKHFFDNQMMARVRERERQYLEKYGRQERVTDDDCDYFMALPLSNVHRPQWDQDILSRLGFFVEIEEDIGRKVYEEWEKALYGESPLFEICGVKRAISEDKSRVQNYWQKRASSFGFNFSPEMIDKWQTCIKKHLPQGRLKVLDAGTGPGFMAAVMAMMGHEVTGVDMCSKMIEQAKANAELVGLNIRFICTDAGELPFDDETFDVVICRDVLWALTDPEDVLIQWHRVLKTDGLLIYFDGNHYLYLYNDGELKAREAYFREYGNPYEKEKAFDYKEMEEAAKKLPLSRIYRPEWDETVLPRLGYKIIYEELKSPEDKRKSGDKSSSSYYKTFMMVAKKITDDRQNDVRR